MRLRSTDAIGDGPGRYVAGRTFAHFCVTPRLWGVMFWGRPNATDTEQLARSMRVELEPGAVRHGSVIDLSRVDSVDTAAFGVLETYVRQEHEALARQVSRQVLIRPDGMAGAVVAGFFDVTPAPYPVRVVDSHRMALDWLAEEHPDALPPGSDLGEMLAAVHAEAASVEPCVRELRAVIEQRLDGVSMADAARKLGVSERTLQRRLSDAGTTFHRELSAARLRVAMRLLVDTDLPLTTIAFDVGCGSPQRFSALFRKLAGESPSTWRARQRK